MRRWQMVFFCVFFSFFFTRRDLIIGGDNSIIGGHWWGHVSSVHDKTLSLILLNLKWLKHIKDVVFPQSEPNVYFIFEVTEQSYAQCSLLTFHRPHLYVFILASLISAFCKIVPASYSIMSQYQNQLIINKQKKKNQHILKKNCYN